MITLETLDSTKHERFRAKYWENCWLTRVFAALDDNRVKRPADVMLEKFP
jgi:hypothetical protein